ncbi:MAG: TIGR00730 family Rossman fold protein [Muribaculaceae bacterium]|nr:TIGR00730 family Rossman fold protein [Muribaculaceae bacterium]
MTQPNGVAVYCASSSRVPEIYLNSARETGMLLARAGLTLVCGGGYRGLMGQAIDGALASGGEAVGVLPQFMIDRGWAHPGLTRTISTPTMHVRKHTMASMSRAAIALAGGIGTLDELAEMMTWHQLKLFEGPVIIVNTAGYYDPLIQMFGRMQAEGFMRNDIIPATIVQTPAQAIELITQ